MTNSTTSGLDNTTVLDGDDLLLVSKKSGGTYLSRNVKYSVIQNAINKVVTDLSPIINSKANQTDLDLTNTQVNLKANQTDLNLTNAQVNLKANQADLIATNNLVNTKANQTDLDATNATVNQKANTVDVYSKTDLSMTKRIQDANELQLGAGANGWTSALVLDSESGLTQSVINAKQRASLIDYDKVVTVGLSGADFTTINAALTELSKYKKVYLPSNDFSNTKAKILIKSGHVVAEQININSLDLSWIDIESEDAEVVVSRAALTQKVGRWYSFIRCKSGAIPSIKTLFTMDNTGTATERVHLYMINARGFIEADAGFKNAGERNCDITQSSTLNCARGIFTGAGNLNFRAATASTVFMQYANASNAPTGMSFSTGASIAAENTIVTNCTANAIQVQGGVTIDLTQADVSYAGQKGISASSACVINAASITANNCQYGIYAENGATVDAINAQINNNTIVGVIATTASVVSLRAATLSNNQTGAIASMGGTVGAYEASIIGSVDRNIAAQNGGMIIINDGNYRKNVGVDDAFDATLSAGGTIIAINATGGVPQKSDVQTEKGIIVKGIKSRNTGQSVIASGTTSLTVNHGLGIKPSTVQVTMNANLGAGISYWVTARTETTFDLRVSAALAAATLFYWSAEA